MATLTTPPLLTDSLGVPANGTIAVRALTPFMYNGKLITGVTARGVIVNGEFFAADGVTALDLPVTPTGVALDIWVTLKGWVDGRPQDVALTKRTVSVADQATVTWLAGDGLVGGIVDVVDAFTYVKGDFIVSSDMAMILAAADVVSASILASAQSATDAGTSATAAGTSATNAATSATAAGTALAAIPETISTEISQYVSAASTSATDAAASAALAIAPTTEVVSAIFADKTSAPSIELSNTIDGAQASNAFPARKLATKLNTRATLGTVQRARVLAFGDSIGLFKWHMLYKLLDRSFGGRDSCGAVIGAGPSGTGWSVPGVGHVASSGTITNQTSAFDAWPSGLVDSYATGATKSYGILGSNPTWDTAKVYYVKESGAGTFKVQIDGVDESGFTSVSAAGTGLGIITITRGTAASRAVRIVNLTGTHRIVGTSFEDSTQAGVLFANVSQGGIALDQQTTQGYANFQTFLADFNPDLITFEMKENSSYLAAKMEQLLTVIDAGAPVATFVGIGSTPIAVNDADQVIQNAQIRAACLAHGKVYWDGYAPFGSYAAINALGWAGDGIHVAEAASSFLSGLMARDLGLFDHAGSERPFNVNALKVTVQEKIVLGRLGNLTVTGSDVVLDASGNFTVSGTNGVVLRIPAGGGTANAVVPNTAQIGLGNSRWTADTNGISSKNPAGSGDANVNGKQIIAISQGLRTLPVATGSRPSGGVVGDGTMLVDSTLNKPIWWVNGAWRDATGTAV
ncbi:hypothetical protein D6T64_12175 [Cryobacterium melibiosiphilum]|uniref:Uncharacterized protein n=1 Tax=Cryobacterium melibiosiphilum TaxID=995039 RepID=A0A3A5MPY8_9MICO|nr:hypothetical protein [Cryobacterium melibiosiphilum]RJT88136.1 hypothetical protein D6T64_12175 [Cryobacterium melibiosiphilum]